jgi:signal transduction histidine kinase
MPMNSILFFLRTRMDWIGMIYTTWIITYLLFAIGFYYSGFPYSFDWKLFVYSGLLVTFFLCCFLLWQGLQVIPSQDLLKQLSTKKKIEIQTPRNTPLEYQLTWEAHQNVYQHLKAEQLGIEQLHQRHLEFIHIWIHQMKTYVSSLSLLAQQYQNEQKAMILEEIDTLNDGLELALTMARLDHFSHDYQIKTVRLSDLVRQVINEKRRMFIRLHIFPKIEVAREAIDVLTDPKWMHFVLEQLIQNACKYTSQMKKDANLFFYITEEEKNIRLSITDEGPGIPKQDLPRIFDPFFTGENGRQFAEATGMGLYLVQTILTQLQHSIQVESVVGTGTTFHLLFSKVTKM